MEQYLVLIIYQTQHSADYNHNHIEIYTKADHKFKSMNIYTKVDKK